MQARIEGKNCIVTGANSGIGYATAEGLASRCSFSYRTFEIFHSVNLLLRSRSSSYVPHGFSLSFRALCRGATVYMVCRNKERGEAALSQIQSATGNKNVHLEVFDSCILLCESFCLIELGFIFWPVFVFLAGLWSFFNQRRQVLCIAFLCKERACSYSGTFIFAFLVLSLSVLEDLIHVLLTLMLQRWTMPVCSRILVLLPQKGKPPPSRFLSSCCITFQYWLNWFSFVQTRDEFRCKCSWHFCHHRAHAAVAREGCTRCSCHHSFVRWNVYYSIDGGSSGNYSSTNLSKL